MLVVPPGVRAVILCLIHILPLVGGVVDQRQPTALAEVQAAGLVEEIRQIERVALEQQTKALLEVIA